MAKGWGTSDCGGLIVGPRRASEQVAVPAKTSLLTQQSLVRSGGAGDHMDTYSMP